MPTSDTYLDDACPACGRTVGDHTMRDYDACRAIFGRTDLDYEEVDDPKAIIPTIPDDPGRVLVDHVTAKAVIIAAGDLGNLRGLFLDFSTTVPDLGTGRTRLEPGPTVGFVGRADIIRKAGTIIRDAANGAANLTVPGRPFPA